MIEKLSIGKRRMYIHTPGWHTFYFITFRFLTVTRWRRRRSRQRRQSGHRRCSRQRRRSGQRRHSGQRCHRFWWRCTGSFAPPACLPILYSAILAWKAAVRMMSINHCWVSFYCSLHFFMPRKLNSSLLLFLDFGPRFLD